MSVTISFKNNIPLINPAILAGMAKGLETGGKVFKAKLITQIRSGTTPPPNAPATIKAKGSSATLVATGEMVGAVSSELRDNGRSVVVGIINNEAAATKFLINEFGAPSNNIPERSTLRVIWNDQANRDEMNTEVITKMREAIAEVALK
jgi:hypothetical protein